MLRELYQGYKGHLFRDSGGGLVTQLSYQLGVLDLSCVPETSGHFRTSACQQVRSLHIIILLLLRIIAVITILTMINYPCVAQHRGTVMEEVLHSLQ